jgi:hypothetical protein
VTLFQIIAVPVALYALYAALAGEVYAKAGAWGRTISRQDSPVDFWMTVAIYAGLAVAMATLF